MNDSYEYKNEYMMFCYVPLSSEYASYSRSERAATSSQYILSIEEIA